MLSLYPYLWDTIFFQANWDFLASLSVILPQSTIMGRIHSVKQPIHSEFDPIYRRGYQELHYLISGSIDIDFVF
jgi:hypothetical protein